LLHAKRWNLERGKNGLLLSMQAATPEDLPAILELLESLKLPRAGVKDHFQNFVLEFENDRLLACAGFEIYGDAGLLRSVAVNLEKRSKGIGSKLVNALLENAKSHQLSSISLLTETAQDYFPQFGFKRVTRENLPKSLNASKELRGACPDTAVVMMLEL
jgi:amino-acid N-acetyltransferase